jgi:hypothetical protein
MSSLSVTFTLDDDLVGIMSEAIEDGVGNQRIVKELHPFLHMPTAGQDDRRGSVAFDDNFVKVVGLFGSEFLEAEVVHDEKRGTKQSEQFFVEGLIGPALEQSFEEEVGSEHQDLDASPAGAMSQGVGKVGFADSDRAAEEDIFVPFEEAETEEVFDLFLVQGDGSLPVEAFEGLIRVDPGLD